MPDSRDRQIGGIVLKQSFRVFRAKTGQLCVDTGAYFHSRFGEKTLFIYIGPGSTRMLWGEAKALSSDKLIKVSDLDGKCFAIGTDGLKLRYGPEQTVIFKIVRNDSGVSVERELA